MLHEGSGWKYLFSGLFSSTRLQQQGAFTLCTDSVWHSAKIFDIFHIFAKEAWPRALVPCCKSCRYTPETTRVVLGTLTDVHYCMKIIFGRDDGSKCCCFLIHSWLRCTFPRNIFGAVRQYSEETCCLRIFGVYSPSSVEILPVSIHLLFTIFIYLT